MRATTSTATLSARELSRFLAGLIVGLCVSIAGVIVWQMRYFGDFTLIWAIVTLCISILIFVAAKREARNRRNFLVGALTTVPVAPAATAIFVILLNLLVLTGFNPGIDRTPPGCDLLKVNAAWYQARNSRIFIHLSNGSTYWARSTTEYLSWRDKHIGPYARDANVIVCPPTFGSAWDVHSNIVGEEGGPKFYRVQIRKPTQ